MTITVRFHASSQSQAELTQVLHNAIADLERDGILAAPLVELVFPGETAGEFKGIFTITGRGRETEAARRLTCVPGIASAYVAPVRSTFGAEHR